MTSLSPRRSNLAALGGAFIVTTALTFAPSLALADAESDEGHVKAAMLELDKEVAALSAEDCTSACKALASIRRAARRICELDPGQRCADARAKSEDASRRVRDACPQCAIAKTEELTPKPENERESHGSVHPTANAPPAESKRGGCAGCTTSAVSAGDFAWVLAVASALAMRRRRR